MRVPQPVIRVEADLPSESAVRDDEWPFTIPAVGQILREGLDLPPGITFLVGANGSGKSTIVEAIAAAYGLNPEGGSLHARHFTRDTESPLHGFLRLVRDPRAPNWAYFSRSETLHGFLSYVEDTARPDSASHGMSHGEAVLGLLRDNFESSGFDVLDEPESGLAFIAQLALIQTLRDIVAAGGQVLCATHSPLLTAFPGATIVEAGDHGFRASTWEDLAEVRHWRAFLDTPERYLRPLGEESLEELG